MKKIATRLFLFLAVISLLFGIAFLYHHFKWRGAVAAFFRNYKDEKKAQFTIVDELQARNMRCLAQDFTRRPALAEALRRGDAAGALPDSGLLSAFGVDAVWIYKADGGLFYSFDMKTREEAEPLPPVARAARPSASQPWKRFFIRRGGGFMEVQGGLVAQKGVPAGFFYAGRRWDAAHVIRLAQLTECRLRLAAAASGGEERAPARRHARSYFEFVQEYPGADGKPMLQVRAAYDSPLLRSMHAYAQQQALGFVVSIVLLAFGGAVLINSWVARPLTHLTTSFASADNRGIRKYIKTKTEFGRLAQLMADFFKQQMDLKKEVQARRETEAALRESEKQVRRSAAERSRMARDLHDGVVQALYAISLQLERAGRSLAKEKHALSQPLRQTENQLRQVISQVREFMRGVEPENISQKDLREALRGLTANLSRAYACEINLEADRFDPAWISREHTVNLFFAAQELLSNALRHARPARVTCRLFRREGRLRLEVEDDGAGFDAANISNEGRGLENIRRRIGDMRGDFAVETGAEGGTRAAVEIPLAAENQE